MHCACVYICDCDNCACSMEMTSCANLTGTMGHNISHHRQWLAPHQLTGRVLWVILWETLYTLWCVLYKARQHNMFAVSSTSIAIVRRTEIYKWGKYRVIFYPVYIVCYFLLLLCHDTWRSIESAT